MLFLDNSGRITARYSMNAVYAKEFKELRNKGASRHVITRGTLPSARYNHLAVVHIEEVWRGGGRWCNLIFCLVYLHIICTCFYFLTTYVVHDDSHGWVQ
jgi:hypothetical protein